MSSDLQEMDNVVKKGAKAGEGMDTSLAGKVDDLGGPTPENYRPTDDSAKLKDPEALNCPLHQPPQSTHVLFPDDPTLA